MDRPIGAIIDDLENVKNHSARLNSLDAANYLNEELLQQIEVLRSDNQQLRSENDRLRLDISTVSRLPSIDSGYPLTSAHQLPEVGESQTIDDIDSYYIGDDQELCEMDQSGYGHSVYSSQSKISQHNVTSDLARVQHCQQKINNLEAEAERARTQNRVLMADFSGRLKEKSRYLGQSLSLVRPYFEARKQSIRRRTEAEQLSTQYHQTIQMLKGARELVKVAEAQMAEYPLEPQWLEMLNEANEKAQTAALERDRIHRQHKQATFIYSKCDKVAKRMAKENGRTIKKCEDYFKLRDEFEQLLEDNGKNLRTIEVQLVDAKASLSTSLQQLGKQSRPKQEETETSTVDAAISSPKISTKSNSTVKSTPSYIDFDQEWFDDF